MKQSLLRVGSFSGNVEAPAELGGESERMLSEVLAVMNLTKTRLFSVTSTTCPRLTTDHIQRRPIDIEAAVGREGN